MINCNSITTNFIWKYIQKNKLYPKVLTVINFLSYEFFQINTTQNLF